MLRDLTLSHIDGIEAQLMLLKAHLDALRHHVTTQQAQKEKAPVVAVALPERCAGVPAHGCAMQEPDAKLSRASFADPCAWRCAGCGFESGAVT